MNKFISHLVMTTMAKAAVRHHVIQKEGKVERTNGINRRIDEDGLKRFLFFYAIAHHSIFSHV
jgi:hypothetical protein